MDRNKLIRELLIKKNSLNRKLTNYKYNTNGHILNDTARFLKLEKEIQIQQSYKDHEVDMEK